MMKDRTVWAVNISVFLLMVGVGLIVAVLPMRIIDLAGSISSVGMLASMYALSTFFFLPIGRLADRFGPKRFLVAGYLLCAVAGVLFFYAATPNLIFMGRFIQGIAEIPIWALAPALLSLRHPARKGRHMGIYNACLHAGLATGGLLSMAVFSRGQGNGAFLFFAALSVAGGLLVSVWVRSSPCKAPVEMVAVGPGCRVPVWRDGKNLAVLAGILLYGAGYGNFITIVPAFLISARGMDQAMIGFYFTSLYIALGFSQLVAGPVSDRWGRQMPMFAGLAVAGCGIAIFSQLSGFCGLGALFTACLGLGVFCVAAMAFLNDRVPDSMKATVTSTFFFCWGSGYFLGPLALGAMGNRFGYPVAFVVLATSIGFVLTAVIFFVPSRGPLVGNRISTE